MTGYILVDSPNRAQPQGTYPRRGGAQLSGTCIVHTSEGNWRSGVDGLTNLVRTRADWGCYHRACDWADIALYYPWEWETWQDTETNNWAVGIAAACKTTDWATMPADIRDGYYRNMGRMAADFVQYMAGKGVHVPLRRLTGAEARARVPGFCAHGDSGLHRSDPGPQFDWALFFEYTRQALGGSLSAHGTITPTTSPEDDLMATPEQRAELIRELLDTQIDQAGGGKVTFREHLAETRPQHMDQIRVTEDVINQEFVQIGTDGKPSGKTTISNVLGAHDANVVLTRGLIGRDVTVIVDSLIAADVAREVLDGLAERLGK